MMHSRRHDGARPLFVMLPPEGATDIAGALATEASAVVVRVGAESLVGARTLPAIATRLIGQLREVQPIGPFRIAGVGAAGALAFEVARQLVGADEVVEFLGLVHAHQPSWAERRARLAALDGRTDTAVFHRAVLENELRPLPLQVHLFAARDEGAETTRGWGALVRTDRLRVVAPGAATGAAHLGEALLRAAEVSPPPADGPPPSCLVTIQRGERGMPPVFCLPGAGAGAADFVHLVSAWGPKHAVHGFQHRGLEGLHVPHSTVEAAATSHLRELNRVAPGGDVHLVGHSFGGWLAFELGTRLEAAGRHVTLTLLDSGFPGGGGRVGREYTRPEVLVEMATLFELMAGRSLEIAVSDFEVRDVPQQLALLHSRLLRLGLLPRQTEPSVLSGPVDTFEAALRTVYRPRAVFHGGSRLVLVPWIGETEDQSRARFDDAIEGWSKLSPRLEYRCGAGNHVTMLKPPHVRGLADWTLRSLQGTSPYPVVSALPGVASARSTAASDSRTELSKI